MPLSRNAHAKEKAEILIEVGHTSGVNARAFSPDGHHLASGSYDNTIRLWDRETGQLVRTYEGHTDWVMVSFLRARAGGALRLHPV